ncbi:MAG: TPM domain-containing protein, partial [bacterium]
VGSGLELILKDEIVAKIIREIIAPEFRNQKYGRGIYLGIDNLKNLIESNKNLIGKRPKL